MVILSDQKKRMRYFRDQAYELRKKAQYHKQQENWSEVERLEDLAYKAEQKADNLKKQINSNRT